MLRLRLPRIAGGQLGDGLEGDLDREAASSEGGHRLRGRPAELDGDERRFGQAEVRRIGIGCVEEPAVVVGHGHAEARLVDLQAERGIALPLLADEGPQRAAGGRRELGRIDAVGRPCSA